MDEKLMDFEANFSVLDRYGEDVTANEFITNPAIGRDEEIKELILILLTPEKSAILIGKPGIGKTAIVEGLAYRMQLGDVPEALKGYTIINIKTASLLGTMPSGESKVQKMIDELKTRDKVILFVDEVHMLIGATDSSSLDFANIFKEGLGRGSIKVIGATTTEEYERYILRDKAFTRRFQKVEVPEPSKEETVKIMMGTLPKFEKQTGRKMKYTSFIQQRIMTFLVDITSEYKRVFALGSRYPDVCLTLLKQAFSYTVYDNREYMDIFDIRKAIENSKNIYPDVVKKELPNFDKLFNDIILEERGEKPVEEWRRESGPTRYEQEINSNDIIAKDSKNNNESILLGSDEIDKLGMMPSSMVDKNSIKDMQPVKAILSEKTLNKFARIGPTAISKGLKDRFNRNSDSKNIDDLLLSSRIGVIEKVDESKKVPNVNYRVTDELLPGGTTNLLLGAPIPSTVKKKVEKKDPISKYKSDNLNAKELDPNRDSLILNVPTERSDSSERSQSNRNGFELSEDMLRKYGGTTAQAKEYIREGSNSKLDRNDPKNSFLFGGNPNNNEDRKRTYDNSQSAEEVEVTNPQQFLSSNERLLGRKDSLFGAPMYSDDYNESISKNTSQQARELVGSEESRYNNTKPIDLKSDFLFGTSMPSDDYSESINRDMNQQSREKQFGELAESKENSYNNVEQKDLKSDFLFGAPMYDTKSNESSSKTTDIFGQLIVPETNMRIKNGKIVDDFSNLGKIIDENKMIVSDVSDAASLYENINFNVPDVNMNSSNERESFDNSTYDNNRPKKNKFIQGFEEEKEEPKPFVPLEIGNRNNSNRANASFDSKRSNGNGGFLNFSDLNSGKIPSSKVNDFVSVSHEALNKNNEKRDDEIKFEVNNKQEAPKVILDDTLKLEDNGDNENYFDDFYDE